MKDKTLILLLPDQNSCDELTAGWLSEMGLRAWKANDVEHVFEELSDFTVQNRPDVILLEVPALSRDYESVQTSIREFSGGTSVTVAAYGTKRTAEHGDSRFVTMDLDELRSLICDEMPYAVKRA